MLSHIAGYALALLHCAKKSTYEPSVRKPVKFKHPPAPHVPNPTRQSCRREARLALKNASNED